MFRNTNPGVPSNAGDNGGGDGGHDEPSKNAPNQGEGGAKDNVGPDANDEHER